MNLFASQMRGFKQLTNAMLRFYGVILKQSSAKILQSGNMVFSEIEGCYIRMKKHWKVCFRVGIETYA